MYIKPLLSTLALCAVTLSQAQQHLPLVSKIKHHSAQRTRSSATFLPLTEKQFGWNPGAAVWDSVAIRNYHYTASNLDTVNIGDPVNNVHNSREIYSQTATEHVVVKQILNGATWENTEKSVETFDSEGFATGNQFYLWLNNDWSLQYGDRYLTSYDGNGNLVGVEMQSYDNTLPDWVTYQNEIAQYNQGLVSQLRFQEPSADGTLEDIVKVEFIYSNGALQADTAMIYSMFGGQWILGSRYIVDRWIQYDDIVNIEPVTYVEQEYTLGVFTNVSRQTRSDFDNEGYSDLLEYFDGTDWYASSLFTVLNDDRGNLLLQKSESISLDQTTIDFASQYAYWYDSNDNMMERIEQFYDFNLGEFVNLSRSVFGAYLDVTGLEKLNDAAFSVYPNPAQDVVFLSGTQKIGSVRILSMQGQVVWEGSYTPSGLDVHTLDAGLYLIEGMLGQERVHSRFIKH